MTICCVQVGGSLRCVGRIFFNLGLGDCPLRDTELVTASALVRCVFLAMAFGALSGVSVSGALRAVVQEKSAAFGASNPFYAKSRLPFVAPPFDKSKDSDYEPAIEAGMAEELKEVEA